MPEGLPNHLCSDKRGFDALCALLTIGTTKQKHVILNAHLFKQALKAKASRVSRNAKTSERVRQGLMALYSDPELRRKLWRALLSHEEASNDPSRRPVPSIEHEALNRYDNSLFAEKPTGKGSGGLFGLLLCRRSSKTSGVQPPWLRSPEFGTTFCQWVELSRERQETVLLAAFATSTLLDDVRLLRWAAERVDEVSKEFEFVGLASEPESSNRVPQPNATTTPSEKRCPEPTTRDGSEPERYGPAAGRRLA